MQITSKEIRSQSPQIQRYVANTMCPIDKTEYALLPTDLYQGLKREPYTRHTDDGVEHRDLHIQPLTPCTTHDILEPFHQVLMANRQRILNLPGSHGAGLHNRVYILLHGAIDRVEVDDCVSLLED